MTLFRPGAKSASTDFNRLYFVIMEAKLPNFSTFPKMYLEIIWYDMSLFTELAVTMATLFWQNNLEFSCFLNKNIHFLAIFFTCLNLFNIDYILASFGSFLTSWEDKKSKMAAVRKS